MLVDHDRYAETQLPVQPLIFQLETHQLSPLTSEAARSVILKLSGHIVMDALHSLSVSVTPVVLIFACGLVTLSLYNRLNAVVARIRAFHQQKIELLESLGKHESSDRQMLLELIDSQIGKVTVKAKAIQKGLFCLLAAVLAFLLCSLFEAASVWHELLGVVALGIHLIGLCLFFIGVGWAMRELTLSLTPLEEESAYLETLTKRRLAKTLNTQEITIAKAA